MRKVLQLIAVASVVCVVSAQTPAPQPTPPAKLQNTGKPMQVATQCTDDDIQTLGLSCTREDPCALFLELSGIESTGARLFISGNVHTASTTVHSILLASEDGGQFWTEPVSRIRSGIIDQIQFTDLESGWISGSLLLGTPRDPFFLITNDGGKNWRKRNVFSESRNGTIEAFWFDSRKDGMLLIDRVQTGGEGGRYELYESRTAGDSWSIREISPKPLKLKRPLMEPEARGWRLRADPASKSYRVERRDAERWQPVASFLVATGSCRPPEVMEAPDAPPPEEPQPAAEVAAPKSPVRKPPSLKQKGKP
jgi:hypothetical protein